MDFICSKMQNIKKRGQERDKAADIRSVNFACDLSVTAICITGSFASKIGHCPTASVLHQ